MCWKAKSSQGSKAPLEEAFIPMEEPVQKSTNPDPAHWPCTLNTSNEIHWLSSSNMSTFIIYMSTVYRHRNNSH